MKFMLLMSFVVVAKHSLCLDILFSPSHHSIYQLLVSTSHKQEADESLNFEEQILEAAKSIAAATSALVKAASAAQRELVAQGKVRQSSNKLKY